MKCQVLFPQQKKKKKSLDCCLLLMSMNFNPFTPEFMKWTIPSPEFMKQTLPSLNLNKSIVENRDDNGNSKNEWQIV